ncbi:hypothetical protein D3C76_495470 [compost metagenome]
MLDVFPDQQLRPFGIGEFPQQCLGLGAARLAADQQRRAAQADNAAQALRRQPRVQRQVAGTGLEAADDHAQQVQAALGQQCHRLVEVDIGGDQRVTQAVAALVQCLVAVVAVQAGGGNALRMGRYPGLEQRHIALLQRVGVFTFIATVNQELLFCLTQQRQVVHVAMKTFHQGQQQALELRKQTFDAGALEVALVIGQVQAQVVARVAHHGQREVGVGAA